MPELAEHGAYDRTDVYTVADVATITAFANARGIDVVLEVDMPGHTTSVAESHRELVACRSAEPWTTYANEPPAGQLRCVAASSHTLMRQAWLGCDASLRQDGLRRCPAAVDQLVLCDRRR